MQWAGGVTGLAAPPHRGQVGSRSLCRGAPVSRWALLASPDSTTRAHPTPVSWPASFTVERFNRPTEPPAGERSGAAVTACTSKSAKIGRLTWADLSQRIWTQHPD